MLKCKICTFIYKLWPEICFTQLKLWRYQKLSKANSLVWSISLIAAIETAMPTLVIKLKFDWPNQKVTTYTTLASSYKLKREDFEAKYNIGTISSLLLFCLGTFDSFLSGLGRNWVYCACCCSAQIGSKLV